VFSQRKGQSDKPENELHGQGRVSVEIGKFIKQKNESSQRKGGVPSGLLMTLQCVEVSINQSKVLHNFIC
jgi:hypothetical protein